MSTITLNQRAWHDTCKLKLYLPDDWQVNTYDFVGAMQKSMEPGEIEYTIVNPVGMVPIREYARGKKEVVIIFDDMTRITRTAGIVPFVIEELKTAGISDSHIQFICATGAHCAWDRGYFSRKLGESILARFPVYNHNPYENCTYIGNTSYGTPVSVNSEVMQCDLKIGIGAVVPHPSPGFGGGGKIILPGVCSIDSIEHFHRVKTTLQRSHPGQVITGMGVYRGNPVRDNIEEAAILAGLDMKIDALINGCGETVYLYAGALRPTYMAALDMAVKHYHTQKTNGESIIIANTFAKADEAIIIGLHTAFTAVDQVKGGDVVLIMNAPDGQVIHYLMGTFGKRIAGRMKLVMKVPPYVNHLIVFSEYSDRAGRNYIEQSNKVHFMNKWEDVIEALVSWQGIKTKVALIPNAEIQYLSSSTN